jgi:hypothetical protein
LPGSTKLQLFDCDTIPWNSRVDIACSELGDGEGGLVMKTLSAGPMLFALAMTMFQAIPLADYFNLHAPQWLMMGCTVVAVVLCIAGAWMSAQYHSWAPYVAARRREALRQYPQALAIFLVAVVYLGYLSLAGDRLGWSLERAGSIGIFLIMVALLAGECWAWAAQSWRQTSRQAPRS